jgi:hypothetical protein
VPRSAWPLALLRVTVCLIILISPEPRQALETAAQSRGLWLAPPGLGWFVPVFAACAPHLALVARVLQASALLALIGLWTRASLAVLACCFVLLFGGAQLSGAVLHDMHLLWFLLLLLVSPAARVLSLDAWAGAGDWLADARSSDAALATHAARALLGCVYFFPGLHKLLQGGFAWSASENLKHQLWLKWFQAGGVVPWPRVDQAPLWLSLGGLAVLLFELSFLPCVCWRRGRAFALAMGLAFHAGTQHFLYIAFPSLWACYVVLWDGPRAPELSRDAGPARSTALVALVGGTLLALVASQGLRAETQSWPFACYPTFAQAAPSAIADLAVEVQPPEGPLRVLREGPLPAPAHAPRGPGRAPAQWSKVWALAGLYGEPISPARLLAFATELSSRSPAAPSLVGSRVRFYLESYPTDPARYGSPPLRRTLVAQTRY